MLFWGATSWGPFYPSDLTPYSTEARWCPCGMYGHPFPVPSLQTPIGSLPWGAGLGDIGGAEHGPPEFLELLVEIGVAGAVLPRWDRRV